MSSDGLTYLLLTAPVTPSDAVGAQMIYLSALPDIIAVKKEDLAGTPTNIKRRLSLFCSNAYDESLEE